MSEKDNFNDPITLEYVYLGYSEIAKVLFKDYAQIDDSVKALALLELVKHYFFNTSDDYIDLFRKRNPNAGMLFDMLDKATEERQRKARWEAWKNLYNMDDSLTIEDVLEKKNQEKKERKKEQNKRQYLRRKSNELRTEDIIEKNKLDEENFLLNMNNAVERLKKENNLK